jgi:hypothetical protein
MMVLPSVPYCQLRAADVARRSPDQTNGDALQPDGACMHGCCLQIAVRQQASPQSCRARPMHDRSVDPLRS